jgi:hypothetical protein
VRPACDNWRAGRLLDAAQSSDVINVRVRDEDGGNTQLVAMDDLEYPLGVVARINHQGVASFWIANNVAITLQHSNRKYFVNEFGCFLHGPQYSIGRLARSERLTNGDSMCGYS